MVDPLEMLDEVEAKSAPLVTAVVMAVREWRLARRAAVADVSPATFARLADAEDALMRVYIDD